MTGAVSGIEAFAASPPSGADASELLDGAEDSTDEEVPSPPQPDNKAAQSIPLNINARGFFNI